jgi:hypothetical protein
VQVKRSSKTCADFRAWVNYCTTKREAKKSMITCRSVHVMVTEHQTRTGVRHGGTEQGVGSARSAAAYVMHCLTKNPKAMVVVVLSSHV